MTAFSTRTGGGDGGVHPAVVGAKSRARQRPQWTVRNRKKTFQKAKITRSMKLKTWGVRVRHQGLESRTRWLRVRCMTSRTVSSDVGQALSCGRGASVVSCGVGCCRRVVEVWGSSRARKCRVVPSGPAPVWVAPLAAPAVDLTVVALLVSIRRSSACGTSSPVGRGRRDVVACRCLVKARKVASTLA